MKVGNHRLVLTALTVLIGACQVPMDAMDEPVGSSEQAILNGDPLDAGQFPTVVAIVVGGGGLCTGTLIAPDTVITAAHCISPKVIGLDQDSITSRTQVVLDATDLVNGSGRPIAALETIPHSSFNQPGNPDVGIIRLAQNVTDRKPTPLNFDAAAAQVGVEVTMVGYGQTENGTAGEGFYLVGERSVRCSDWGVSDGQFLCFDQQAGRGKCSGDSGGPSFAEIDGVQTLVGITSFGDQNCEYFGADYRVDVARPFLEDNAPEVLCVEDSICDEQCGSAGKAADPDCGPSCFTNDDCDTDSVCNVEQGACEPAPFAPGGIGATCGDGLPECASGLCATASEGSFCTQSCASDDECPDGFTCAQASDGGGACWVASASDGGGCQASSNGNGAVGFLSMLAMVMVLGYRRRREQR